MKISSMLLHNTIRWLGIFFAFFVWLKTSFVIAGELREFPREQRPFYEMQREAPEPIPEYKYLGEYKNTWRDIKDLSDPAIDRFRAGLIDRLREAVRSGDSEKEEYFMGLIKFVSDMQRKNKK